MGRDRPIGALPPLALLGVLVALALAFPTSAGAATAKSADSFVDSIGVNVHLGFDGTPYYDQLPALKLRLAELGIRHVRDGIAAGRDDQYGALNQLAQQGIRSTLILGDPSDGSDGLDELVSIVKTELPDAVEAVEGPNEWSTSGSPDWKAELIAYQERLYADVKGDPDLAALPVIGASIVHGDQATLGDISDDLDLGNIHSYPEGNGPEYKMGTTVERAELNSGAKPIAATETGYTTALGWTPSGPGENRPISEGAMATYVPRLFFEYFGRGIARTFSYELVDEHPDPGLSEREDHFGLLRNDLSEKPAFTALANTIQILEDPGPAFSPGSLTYTPVGDTANLHQVLLQKRDGTFYLALWRIASVWDPIAKEALAAQAEPVTLQLPPGVGATALYDPTSSAAPVPSFVPSATPTVEVGAGIAILALAPVAAELPTAPPIEPTAAAPGSTGGGPPDDGPPDTRPPASCVVPGLKGRSLRAGRERLGRAGCSLGRVRGVKVRSARVVRQSPGPGTVLAPGSRVSVKLSRPRR